MDEGLKLDYAGQKKRLNSQMMENALVEMVADRDENFSYDEDVAEILTDRDDVNASAAVNKFLREFLTSGRGAEAFTSSRSVRISATSSSIENDRGFLGTTTTPTAVAGAVRLGGVWLGWLLCCCCYS